MSSPWTSAPDGPGLWWIWQKGRPAPHKDPVKLVLHDGRDPSVPAGVLGFWVFQSFWPTEQEEGCALFGARYQRCAPVLADWDLVEVLRSRAEEVERFSIEPGTLMARSVLDGMKAVYVSAADLAEGFLAGDPKP